MLTGACIWGSIPPAGHNCNQSGGSLNINSGFGGLYFGWAGGAGGVYNLSGSGLLSLVGGSDVGVCVGYSGTGTFNQSGGTNLAGHVDIARNTGSSGTYNLSGTGLLSCAGVDVGGGGTGTFNQSGGTNTLSSQLWLAQLKRQRNI